METEKVIQLFDAVIYRGENKILENVSLEISAGEFVYLTGKVGTGKTSLIKTLNAEIPLVEGTGTVSGFQLKNIRRKDIPDLRKKLGVVFQDFRLLTDRNVFENLRFVLKATGWKNKKEMEARITEVLLNVGQLENIRKMPHQLSGGEQQKVVIARALLNNPPVLLADEPTGNLDPETSHEIMDLFWQFNRAGKTVLMATHDFASIAGRPARKLVCANGIISE